MSVQKTHRGPQPASARLRQTYIPARRPHCPSAITGRRSPPHSPSGQRPRLASLRRGRSLSATPIPTLNNRFLGLHQVMVVVVARPPSGACGMSEIFQRRRFPARTQSLAGRPDLIERSWEETVAPFDARTWLGPHLARHPFAAPALPPMSPGDPLAASNRITLPAIIIRRTRCAWTAQPSAQSRAHPNAEIELHNLRAAVPAPQGGSVVTASNGHAPSKIPGTPRTPIR